MPHVHRHSDAHHGSTPLRSGGFGHSRHAAPLSRRAREVAHGAPADKESPAESRSRHHSSPSPGGSAGNRFSLLCLLSGGLGFAVVLVATAVSRASQTPSPFGLAVFAGACAAVSLAAGVRAQVSQLRHWSRRVKRKLLVGIPLALCTALAVIVSVRERSLPPAEKGPAPALQASAQKAKPEDNNLIKPGWYGEALVNGVLLVITSFEEEAAESRRFNRRLFKPVTYATLSVINTGSAAPVTLATPQVTLLLDSGKRATTLSVPDLLSHGSGADSMLDKRLAEQQQIPVGGMVPDIPLCMDAPFSWSRVAAVEVTVGAGPVTVPGRMMTVAEKQAVLARGVTKRPSSSTNVTAETWFKDL